MSSRRSGLVASAHLPGSVRKARRLVLILVLAAASLAAVPGSASARSRSHLARAFRAPMAERRVMHTPASRLLRGPIARDPALRLGTGRNPEHTDLAAELSEGSDLHLGPELERLRQILVGPPGR